MWGRELTELLGCSEEILDTTFCLADEQEDVAGGWTLPHRRVLAGEPQTQLTLHAQERDLWVQVIARPVQAPDGTVSMAVSILHDITERIHAERRKDMFISMTSHELKTPVTSLKGFTTLLQRRLRKQEDEQSLFYLSRIDAQLTKLTRLINDLLDISRMQTGKLTLCMVPLDLDRLLDETVDHLRMTISTHQLVMDGATQAQVLDDTDRLGQVVSNLLTNAVKYSPGAERVLIRCFREEEQVIVSVQDFGIGIEQARHECVFERFYQVSDLQEASSAGLGIGLYLAREIVIRHQGRLWLDRGRQSFFVALLLLANAGNGEKNSSEGASALDAPEAHSQE